MALVSGYCPAPFSERTCPQITVMLSPDQVPAKIEVICYSSMGGNESLGLLHRLKSPHPSLPHPGRLVRLFCPIILILLRAVNRLRNNLPMSHGITAQLICHDLPGSTTMTAQNHFEEAFSRCYVTPVTSSAQTGANGMAHYVASKGGVIGFTKALALEYAERGITVNNVPPNFIDTEGLRAAPVDVAAFAQTTPMKRTGKPRNIAAAVAFLASEDADYITGLTLGVNGGRYCN